MANEIDTLQLKITANATTAANGINKLTESLSNLGRKLGPATLTNLGNLNTAINQIGSAGNASAIASITNLSNALSSLAKNKSSVEGFSGSLGKLATSLTRFSKNQNMTTYLSNLGTTFSQFSSNVNSIDAAKLTDISTGMRNIANAASRLGTVYGNLNNVGGNVTDLFINLASGLRKLGHLNIPDSTNLAALVTAISKFGLQSASKAPANITAITSALQNMLTTLSQVNVSNSGIAQLVQSLSSLTTGLGGFTGRITSAANSINMLNAAAQNASAVSVPAIQRMNSTAKAAIESGSAIPGMILKVVSSIGKLVSAIGSLHITDKISLGVQKLATAMGALTRTMAAKTVSIIGNITNRLNIFGRMVGLVSTKTSVFASTIGMLYARFWMLRRVFSILNTAIQKSSDLVETQHIIDVTFGNSSYKLEEFAQNSIQSLGMAEVSAKQFAARFQSMGTALGYSQGEMADYSIELTRLAGNMASFYNRDYNDTAKALESIFTGQTKPLMVAA